MAVSPLLYDSIDFAGGMPAFVISWKQFQRDIKLLLDKLSGTAPGKPAATLGNIPLGDFGLAYSSFIKNATITTAGPNVFLEIDVLVNVHPINAPSEVIREYNVTTTSLIQLIIDITKPGDMISWTFASSFVPVSTSTWGVDHLTHLKKTTLPLPLGFPRSTCQPE